MDYAKVQETAQRMRSRLQSFQEEGADALACCSVVLMELEGALSVKGALEKEVAGLEHRRDELNRQIEERRMLLHHQREEIGVFIRDELLRDASRPEALARRVKNLADALMMSDGRFNPAMLPLWVL